MRWIGVRWISVRRIGVRRIGVRRIGVRWIGVRWIGVRWIGLRRIGVRWIGVRSIGVRWIGVRRIGVRWIGVRRIGVRWIGMFWKVCILWTILGVSFQHSAQYSKTLRTLKILSLVLVPTFPDVLQHDKGLVGFGDSGVDLSLSPSPLLLPPLSLSRSLHLLPLCSPGM